MEHVAKYLILVSAAIILILGSLHLFYTFFGLKLKPRDAELQKRMCQVSPIISRETTMWAAWVGFNASHSFGAILFGLVFSYLALSHSTMLLGSSFLLSVGFALLVGYTLLAKKYWFSIPFRCIVVALVMYVGSLAILLA